MIIPPEVPPDVPAEFVKQSVSNSSITVAWSALPQGVAARMQLQTAGGDWSVINELAPVTSSCTIDSLSGSALGADTTYDVRIRAENSAGDSDWVVLTGLLTLPPTPTDLSAMTGGYGIVVLNWAPQSDYTYQIYRDGSLIASTAAQPYTDIIGMPAVTSAYQIAASSSAGSSDLSLSTSASSGAGSATYNYGSPVITCSDNPVTPGSLLTLSAPGAWGGDPTPSELSTQWQRDGSPISGQTSTSYTAVNDDIGHAITYVETYSNVLATASGTSNAIGVYAPMAPEHNGDPMIDAVGANYLEGTTLYVVSPGSWSGNPTSYSYQWNYNGITTGDDGNTLVASTAGNYQCIVTASNAVGSNDAVSNTISVTSPA